MRNLVLPLLFLFFVRPAFGQAVPDYTPKPATPYSSATATDVTVTAPTKADHLRIAAEHLDAAGFGKEAQDVRQKADAEQHSPTKTLMKQIVLNLRVVEFSRTKLGQVDSFPYGGKKGTSVLKLLDERVRTAITAGNESSAGRDLLSLIEAIAKNHLVMMDSEPSLVVVPGRPSYCRAGGEFPYHVKDSQGKEVLERLEYGTRLDLVCNLLSKELLHLEIRIAVKDLDYTNTIRVGDQTIPTVNGTECETSLTARSGQTCVLGGFISENQAQSRSDDKARTNDHATGSQELAEKTQTLIFVTPELVEGNQSSGDNYLFGGDSIPTPTLQKIEEAFGKAGLNGFAIENGRVKVPHSQRATYLAALADAKALPPNYVGK